MCKFLHALSLILIKFCFIYNNKQILHLHFLQTDCKQLKYTLSI